MFIPTQGAASFQIFCLIKPDFLLLLHSSLLISMANNGIEITRGVCQWGCTPRGSGSSLTAIVSKSTFWARASLHFLSVSKKDFFQENHQALNKKGERAPLIYLVKKARCRGFVQCVTFVFKRGRGVSVIVCVRRHVYIC